MALKTFPGSNEPSLQELDSHYSYTSLYLNIYVLAILVCREPISITLLLIIVFVIAPEASALSFFRFSLLKK